MAKVKKIKAKTHKATVKRFKVTRTGKVLHRTQGDNGHGKNYENRRQKKAHKAEGQLSSGKESRKVKRLLGQ